MSAQTSAAAPAALKVNQNRRAYLPVVAAAVAGVVLSAGLYGFVRLEEHRNLAADFGRRSANVIAGIQSTGAQAVMKGGLGCLHGMRDTRLAAETAAEAWRELLPTCGSTNPIFLSSLFWAPVSATLGDRPASHLESGVEIVSPPAEPGEPGPLTSIDFEAHPELRLAMEWARDTGYSALLGTYPTYPLENEPELSNEWTHFLAVYGGEETPSTQLERRRDLVGFAGIRASTRLDRLSSSLIGGVSILLLELPPRADASGASTAAMEPVAGDSARLHGADAWRQRQRVILSGGARWRVLSRPLESFGASHHSGRADQGLVVGLVLTTMLCAYLRSAIGRDEEVRRMVDERTQELRATQRTLEAEIADHQCDMATLQESEERFKTVFEMAPDAHYVCDHDGTLLEVNRAAEELIGYSRSELVGRHFQELPILSPKQAAQAMRALEWSDLTTSTGRLELVLTHKDGHLVVADFRAQPVRLHDRMVTVGIGRDLTEHRRMEREQEVMHEQLRMAQKMEAIGQLAGGVAHDFNNLLTCILGHAELLQVMAPGGSEGSASAQAIEEAAHRGSDLTRQLLGFARRGKQQNAAVDLHVVVGDVVKLLARALPKSIRVSQVLRAREPYVMGDPGQIHQVILNLALNARDAMPEGGQLTFETAIAAAGAAPIGEPARGRFVVLTIRDSGCGIPREIRERIFEPYFTTKPPGQGSGMGLALAYGIVRNHGGTLEVESEAGRGTAVRVHLPLSCDRPEAARATPDALSIPAASRHVLVVDDEPAVLGLIAGMLRRIGFEATAFVDGAEAIEWYRGHAALIDLVIVDLTMPRPGGRECFLAMQAIRPDLKAILASGHGQNGVAQELLDAGMIGFLQKPFRMNDLARAVNEALGSGRRFADADAAWTTAVPS